MEVQNITGNLVDIFNQKITPSLVSFQRGKIIGIEPIPDATGVIPQIPYILPGFTDAHVHIESSMLVPSEFARLAVVHGSVATVSDPHEIANVCGLEGVEFMINNGAAVPFKFNFGAPSCVPATIFETAGASLDAADVRKLLERPEIKYLSEMMNFPGVLFKDPEVLEKIRTAHQLNKPIDGHAPGLRGNEALQYIAGGLENEFPGRVVISTDHECFTAAEALDKLKGGMKILIREGSAAKNFEALIELLHDHPEQIMFCSDDKHPDSLMEGHLNQLCSRAVAKGIDVFKVLRAACVNPVLHYKLDVGLLRVNDPADFILVSDLKNFNVLKTYINGICVAENGHTTIASVNATPINQFNCTPLSKADLIYTVLPEQTTLPVIEAMDGQLITNRIEASPKIENGHWESDTNQDLLKITVVNRYSPSKPAVAFIKNFGLKKGAIASSVAHDSHNIVAVGVSDEAICEAVNLVIESEGGVSCVIGEKKQILPLPVAGLMSVQDGYDVAKAYTSIDKMAKEAGSTLSSPFMTLSFMALLVIPKLKLSDKGLFDGVDFRFISA